MTKTTVTDAEVTETQTFAHALLSQGADHSPHVALGGYIMASALYAQIIGIPLKNLCAIFDNTAEETYKLLGKGKK